MPDRLGRDSRDRVAIADGILSERLSVCISRSARIESRRPEAYAAQSFRLHWLGASGGHSNQYARDEEMPSPTGLESISPRRRRGAVPVFRALERTDDRLLEKLLPSHADALGEQTDKRLRCRACGNTIARVHDRISMLGAYEHRCTNPRGIRFHIGCFREAAGGAEIGEAIDQHTWFAGYRWRIMLCAQCKTHLGWGFHAPSGDRFYGLILDRLIVPH